ncbi:MAG: hypothetical protein OXR73_25825 [Myxococcales bacterium]|nr:hypothetical protein [Myxococcales bacterium]
MFALLSLLLCAPVGCSEPGGSDEHGDTAAGGWSEPPASPHRPQGTDQAATGQTTPPPPEDDGAAPQAPMPDAPPGPGSSAEARDNGRTDTPEDPEAPNMDDPVGAGAATDGAVPATFETLQFVISQAPCLGAGCHNDEQNPLDLRVDDRLLSRLTETMSANCGNVPVINPGKPQDSALIMLLDGPCGPTPRMPLGCVEDADGACVPREYITALEQWIAAGAAP